MKKLLTIVAVLVATIAGAQTQTENYIKTTTYQTPVQEGGQAQVLEDDKIIAVNYFDGLGRAKQSVAVRAGGQGQSTNILDWTDDWTVGQGSTPLFNLNGQSSDSERIFDTNPFGEQSLLWRCGNDAARDADGGWNTDHIAIDKSVGYQYAVWVKRTGSQDGTTYHGTTTVKHLNNTANSNPYFWHGDLPQLDTWYLMVGLIHPYNYNGADTGITGVYDINGNKVKDGTEYKWKSDAVTAYFRSYLYYATDINVRQYFWNPVLTQLDDNQQPIAQLIQQSKPKDIVTHYEYDGLGRQAKSYLPYASDQTQNGAIYTNPLAELNAFYNTAKYENTTNPYSETVFEKSPLNRPLKQAAPGLDWKAKTTGDDHTIKLDTRANNNEDAVIYFKVSFHLGNTEIPFLSQEDNYAANDLYVNITKDENWKSSDNKNHTTEEYKDKLGRVILKRAYNSSSPSSGGAHDTYYVYDDFGNLTYVLPPKVVVTDGVSSTELSELCYQYIYDHRNRLVEKKIPGKDWEWIVYNKLDQPILTQDAIQRPKREWIFTKYDAFGRVAYTGLYKYPIVTTRAGLQQAINNAVDAIQFETKEDTQSIIAGTTIYYSNNAFPGVGIQSIYTINYYDDYEVGNIVAFNPANGSGTWEGMAVTANVKGLPTVSQVRVLGTNQWITTATYYDEKGRPWETHIKNEYLDTEDWVLNKLDFVGKVLKTQSMHTKDGVTITTIDTFTYDYMGRLLTQKQKIGNQTEELIAHNVYDELGQLEQKKVGNAEQAPLQTIDYTYNIRGWLKGINDVNTIGNDLFSFKINYNQIEGLHQVPLLYNGNISQTIWKTANDHTKRSYSYNYDPLNRLTKALVSKGSNLMIFGARSVWGIAYDKNGNIGRISRNGRPVAGESVQMIDELYYTYTNNKLLKVRDAVTSIYKNEGFIDGTNTNNDYEYDINGNMTIDRNKGITGISYNHLNLPTQVTVNNLLPARAANGNIQYIYDATGAKLKKIATEGSSLTTTDYAGNYIYKNGQLQFFNTTEGYVEPDGNNWKYIYQYKDHLNNVRLSYADNDGDGKIDVVRNAVDVDGDGDLAMEIRQEKNYYPFGLTHKGYNDITRGRPHNYGFTGKEEQNELGLAWVDITARNYNPELGRWMNLDPLAEVMRRHSPYNYAFDNPIYFMDPDGMMPQGCCGDFLKGWNRTVRAFNRSFDNTMHNLVTNPVETLGEIADNTMQGLGQLAHDVVPGLSSIDGIENKTGQAITNAVDTAAEFPSMSNEQKGSVTAGVVILILEAVTERKAPVPKATRRTQSAGDKTFTTERAARREAFRKNNVPTSQANNYTRETVYGKNENLLGPNGEPYEVINTKDVNGNPVKIDHHSNGHRFNDNNTYELPHYHGPKGENHYSYPTPWDY